MKSSKQLQYRGLNDLAKHVVSHGRTLRSQLLSTHPDFMGPGSAVYLYSAVRSLCELLINFAETVDRETKGES